MVSLAAQSSPPNPDAAAARSLLLHARDLIEDKFLRGGDVLTQVTSGVASLAASLDELASTFDENAAQDARQALEAASAGLSALPAEQTTRRAIVERLLHCASTLNASVHRMRRDFDFLRLYSVNLQITAGGVAEAGPSFSAFVSEIQKRIAKGCQVINTFAEQSNRLHLQLRNALELEDDLDRHCLLKLVGIPESLNAATGAIASHQARVREILLQVRGPARAVQKKAGSILAALQIGDITRQRIEHVCDGLDWLEVDARALNNDQRWRFELFMRRLLAAQARQTAEDFHDKINGIEADMDAVSREAESILDLRSVAFGGGENGFLQTLNTQTGIAFQVVNDMEAAEKRAIAIGAAAAETGRALSDSIAIIQQIRGNVQNMALNTTLRCGRFGDAGRPLNVIAVELRTQAGNLEENANTALKALGQLAENASALEDSVAHGGAAQKAASALGQAAERIASASDATETRLAQISQQGLAFVSSLSRIMSTLQFERDLGGPLDSAANSLAIDETSTIHTADIQDELRSLLARLAKIYTMASEREVHQRMSEGVAGEIENIVAAPVDDDDLLF